MGNWARYPSCSSSAGTGIRLWGLPRRLATKQGIPGCRIERGLIARGLAREAEVRIDTG